jgi:hypothetical protein
MCDHCADFVSRIGVDFASPREQLTFLETISKALRRGTLRSTSAGVQIGDSPEIRMQCASCSRRFVLLRPLAGPLQWREEE